MTKADIIQALGLLDASKDEHWTTEGLPRLDVVAGLLGVDKVQRSVVTEAAPEFNREVARTKGDNGDADTQLAATASAPVSAPAPVSDGLSAFVAEPQDQHTKALTDLFHMFIDGVRIDSFDIIRDDPTFDGIEDELLMQLAIEAATQAQNYFRAEADNALGHMNRAHQAAKRFRRSLALMRGNRNVLQDEISLYLRRSQEMREQRAGRGVGQPLPIDFRAPRPRPVIPPK